MTVSLGLSTFTSKELEVPFKIDTGENVSNVNKQLYEKLK